MRTIRSSNRIKPPPQSPLRSVKEESGDSPFPPRKFVCDGVEYDTYQDMVNAKRKRNQLFLETSGLLGAASELQTLIKKEASSSRGITKNTGERKKRGPAPIERRKSKRLAGIQSDGMYVEDERTGRFITAKEGVSTTMAVANEEETGVEHAQFYRNRINDGSSIDLDQAVENTGVKWVKEDSVSLAVSFVRQSLQHLSLEIHEPKEKTPRSKRSPRSVTNITDTQSFASKVESLSADSDQSVAKVVPDRIYGIAAHPSEQQLIVCAGDKSGYVGFWNVDSQSEESNGVHLFRFHSGATNCLEWTKSGSALFSASYDGTCRWFDVASEQFDEIFATYDNSDEYKAKLGTGLDSGYHFYTQFACLDERFNTEKCFFLSTSIGTVMNIDLRVKGKERITFHEELSEKKINSVSLHPNGYSLLTGGLDCQVKLWDLRKFGDSQTTRGYKAPQPIAYYNGGKSVNSAFFSPSGRHIVSTTMANKLDIFQNFQQTTGLSKPKHSVRHDNMTGRWLTTFMARWHPSLDYFCVGSMDRPRVVEVFGAEGDRIRGVSGESLTAVASRCCFHPSIDQLVLVGGNSSGRVTIIR